MNERSALSAEKLRRIIDPKELNFKSTEDLPTLDEVIGQERAVWAVSFGIDIESPGYNMYALGPVGTGKSTTIKKFLERKAEDQLVPDDWLYVNNFEDGDKPKALNLPAGKGCEFEKDMDQLVESLETDVPRAFEREEYEKEQERIQAGFQEKRQELFEELEQKAKDRDFTLLQTPAGVVLAPIVRGEVLRPDQFNQLDEQTRQELEHGQEALQDDFQDAMRRIRQLQQGAKDRIQELDRQVVGFAVEHLLKEVRKKYSEFDKIQAFLDNARIDILEKVKADFAVQMDWTPESANNYAQFIATVCREENLKHYDPTGVAQVIEHSARMVSDQKRLATKFGEIVDLVRESNYWAGQNGNHFITADDVTKAIKEKIYRSNRIEERIQEMIEDETILIDTDGEVAGQVNGISVLVLGDYAFGKPSRITARTHVGSGGVVNIERETELGGRIHNKGVMILTGYLGGRYAHDVPLALTAHITFEQSYSEVEGDSASSAELYALLSSLSGHELRQDLGVTGSVNQIGQVQAIGGVNEKIEGFFDVCRINGLTGEQGVLIPKSNVRNLMLREDVVEAVEEGKFHIYPVCNIDDGIELLTGIEAGERKRDGSYPEDTVNWAVQNKLTELANKVKAFAQREGASTDGRGQREKV